MNDVTRKKLDEEISRELDLLQTLDPKNDDYQKVSAKIVQLSVLANKDDESKIKLEIEKAKADSELKIEKEKAEAEASLEAYKRGADSEKFEIEQMQRSKEAKINCWLTIATCVVSLLSFVGTWVANGISQERSEYFESNGHAYTSKFSRFQIKEPNHPNPTVKR